jgi:L-methionine (R)-S-oxide reductase
MIDDMTKEKNYIAAIREIGIRLQKGGDFYADLCNVTAVLKKHLDHVYWIGFYFLKDSRLVLGPFQGTPACVFIETGKGVCASCVREKRVIIVPDVRTFEGHIACDPVSKSEIAIPCFDRNRRLRAVLDLDSDSPDSFDEIDRKNLEKVTQCLNELWV